MPIDIITYTCAHFVLSGYGELADDTPSVSSISSTSSSESSGSSVTTSELSIRSSNSRASLVTTDSVEFHIVSRNTKCSMCLESTPVGDPGPIDPPELTCSSRSTESRAYSRGSSGSSMTRRSDDTTAAQVGSRGSCGSRRWGWRAALEMFGLSSECRYRNEARRGDRMRQNGY
ncbi:hypothetical protein BS50DRAFT_591719 [Corynespora cassiicola Philippines]|uniref:Uncharacterized protein n=1 Tax=Corynespora cassiicola Philippines TaxID=1448308 RepID=A0A2T2NAE3_CORCC|nr:hypothetical protein BS50DRAFT_591719 [Corynespora cassiicola Philippines]